MDNLHQVELIDQIGEDDAEVIGVAGKRRSDVPKPLEVLTDTQFVRMFRLSKVLFGNLVELLRPFLKEQVKETDLDVETRVLIALRFYASGSYQLDIGTNYFMAVSQPTVSRCVRDVTDALNQPEIFNAWVKFPSNIEELDSTRHRFLQKYHVPGIIGCIDCTHVAIFPPNIDDPDNPEYLYVNRRGYHSLNVQLICDSDLRIINVNAKYPGGSHDAYIWNNSVVQNALRNLHVAGHRDYYLLGNVTFMDYGRIALCD